MRKHEQQISRLEIMSNFFGGSNFLRLNNYFKISRQMLVIFTSFFTLLTCCGSSITGRHSSFQKPEIVKAHFGNGIKLDAPEKFVMYQAPGNIRQDRGTIEMWIIPLMNISENKGWRPYVSVTSDSSQASKYDHQLVVINQATDFMSSGLEKTFNNEFAFAIKKGEQNHMLKIPPLKWEKDSLHYIGVTWGPNGMELYLDGKLAAKSSYKGGIESQAPAFIYLGRTPKIGSWFCNSIIDEFKISDIQRTPDYFKANFEYKKIPKKDENTLLISHFINSIDAEASITKWKKDFEYVKFFDYYEVKNKERCNKGNIFKSSLPVKLSLFAASKLRSPESFLLNCRITDYYGNKIKGFDINIDLPETCFGKLVLTPEIKLMPGYYRLEASYTWQKRKYSIRPQAFCVVTESAPGITLFGVDQESGRSVDMMPYKGMKTAGFDILRDHLFFSWPFAEPEKGRFFTAAGDELYKVCQNVGLSLVPIFVKTPEWADKNPPANMEAFKGGKNYAKMVNKKYFWMPAKLSDWEQYVQFMISRYSGVKYWEVWNEPDWHLPQTRGFGFGGSVADYTVLLKATYKIKQKVNPNSKIVLGGLACNRDADEDFVKRLIQLGGMKYFDVLGMHVYGGIEFFSEQVALMKKAGYIGPLWQTEYMSGSCQEMRNYNQISNIIRMLPLRLNAYIVYNDSLYFPNFEPNPAVYAISLLRAESAGMSYKKTLSVNNKNACEAYIIGNNKSVKIITRGDRLSGLYLGVENIKITDFMGMSKVVKTNKGFFPERSRSWTYVSAVPPESLTLDNVRYNDKCIPLAVVNGSFEECVGDPGLNVYNPVDWKVSMSHPGKMSGDSEVKYAGKYSLKLKTIPQQKQYYKASVYQGLPDSMAGRQFELTGWIKTSSPTPSNDRYSTKACVVIWCQSLNKKLAMISEKNSNNQRFVRYKTIFMVPEKARNIMISCCTYNKTNEAWFDDVSIREVK